MSVCACVCVCVLTLSVCQLRDPSLVTWQKGISSSSVQLVLIVRECVRVFCGSSQVPAVSCCSCCCCHCSCSCCYSWRCLLLVERTISPSVCTAAAVAAGGAVEERARYLLSKQPQATQRWPYYQFTDTHTLTHTQIRRHTANNNRWIGHRQVLCGISKSLCCL